MSLDLNSQQSTVLIAQNKAKKILTQARKMLALTRKNLEETIPTLNGKLIVREENKLEEVTLTIQQLTQTVERLESQTIALNQQSQKESLQHLERLYRRLFCATLGTAFGLTILWFGVGSSDRTCSELTPENTSAIASLSES